VTTWTVPARIRRVVDGDTLRVDLDLGWGVWLGDEPIRLAGINADEMNTIEGQAARDFLAAHLEPLIDPPTMWRCSFVSTGFDKYRRALGFIYTPDGVNLSTLMLQSGHAEPYP
jgi:micrococcal nuclease